MGAALKLRHITTATAGLNDPEGELPPSSRRFLLCQVQLPGLPTEEPSQEDDNYVPYFTKEGHRSTSSSSSLVIQPLSSHSLVAARSRLLTKGKKPSTSSSGEK